ncbi:MAG: hypothetical protein ABFD46_04270 [Armatimonadota bacterium]
MAHNTNKNCCAACAENEAPLRIWWVIPGIIGGVVAAAIFAYLHVRFGGMAPIQAGSTAATSTGIFVISYLLLRRIRPQENPSSVKGLLQSTAIALPVFVMAFIGLAYEIGVLADFTAMYILGSWLGTSEAAEKAE